MSALSNAQETAQRDHYAHDTQLPLADHFLALYTDLATEAGGGTEVTGGSYAREQIFQNNVTPPHWEDVGTNGMQNAQAITFTTATASWGTVKAWAIRTALTAGTSILRGVFATNIQSFVGTLSDDRINAPIHGFVNDDLVVLMAEGETLPAGLTELIEYHVVSATTDDFQVSATQGGAAINLTADGRGFVGKSGFVTVNSTDTYEVPIGDLDIVFE